MGRQWFYFLRKVWRSLWRIMTHCTSPNLSHRGKDSPHWEIATWLKQQNVCRCWHWRSCYISPQLSIVVSAKLWMLLSGWFILKNALVCVDVLIDWSSLSVWVNQFVVFVLQSGWTCGRSPRWRDWSTRPPARTRTTWRWSLLIWRIALSALSRGRAQHSLLQFSIYTGHNDTYKLNVFIPFHCMNVNIIYIVSKQTCVGSQCFVYLLLCKLEC